MLLTPAGPEQTSQPAQPTQPALGNPARSPEVLNLLVKLATLALSMSLNESALFISERYSCLCPASEESAFLHSLSLLRCGEARQALELLKQTLVAPSAASMLQGSSLHAMQKACVQLGRPNEGAECLHKVFSAFGNQKANRFLSPDAAVFPEYHSVPTNVSVNLSLAKLAAQANKPDVAAQRFMNALQTSWWCWEAYEGLCKLGKAPEAENCFADVAVPMVPEPPTGPLVTQRLSPEQHFRGGAELDRAPSHRSHSRGRSHDTGHDFSTPAAHGDIAPLLTRKRSQMSSTTHNQYRPTRTSKSAITPNETQGSALRFSEAAGGNEYAEPDTEMYDEVSGPISAVAGDGLGIDTTFFGLNATAGAPRKQPHTTFGLAGISANGGGRPAGAPLFGTGLLFGQHVPKAPTASSATRYSFGGSFFTPVQLNRNVKGGQPNGRHVVQANGSDSHQQAIGDVKAKGDVAAHDRLPSTIREGPSALHAAEEANAFASGGIPNGKASSDVIRTISNPRDRKRTRAGMGMEDVASSSSHSYETEQPADYIAYTSSSPPPAGTNGRYGSNGQSQHDKHTIHQHDKHTIHQHDENVERVDAALSRSTAYRKQVNAAQRALAENWLRSMFRAFGKATKSMSRYKADDTLKAILLDLPAKQQNCSRALLLLARAHYENLNYAKAEIVFKSLRQIAPYAVDGIELYSTLLWHMHRPTQLSFLAQELMAHSDKLPQGWIATGNVFSHLEDHANALKCFKRAIQCNPEFAYSYTLAGHECITLEEWDSALGFFRNAIRKQPQHYNAWFGIGNVYMRTGKYRMAEYHFKRAAEINPSNSMLLCCVGSVLEKLGHRQEALEMYERACLLSPTSPAVRFKRVRMLMELKQYDSALRDLLIVREQAPDEFNVHYLLGKLYAALGDNINMTRSLTFAEDLEPRSSGRIRDLIERASNNRRFTSATSAGVEAEETQEDTGMLDDVGQDDDSLNDENQHLGASVDNGNEHADNDSQVAMGVDEDSVFNPSGRVWDAISRQQPCEIDSNECLVSALTGQRPDAVDHGRRHCNPDPARILHPRRRGTGHRYHRCITRRIKQSLRRRIGQEHSPCTDAQTGQHIDAFERDTGGPTSLITDSDRRPTEIWRTNV